MLRRNSCLLHYPSEYWTYHHGSTQNYGVIAGEREFRGDFLLIFTRVRVEDYHCNSLFPFTCRHSLSRTDTLSLTTQLVHLLHKGSLVNLCLSLLLDWKTVFLNKSVSCRTKFSMPNTQQRSRPKMCPINEAFDAQGAITVPCPRHVSSTAVPAVTISQKICE